MLVELFNMTLVIGGVTGVLTVLAFVADWLDKR